MDFIIANVIANATEAAEDIKQGRKITLFPTSESFGGVTNKKEHFGSKGAITYIIPLAIVILSIYLGVSCDAKKGDSGFIRFLKAVFIYAPFGGLHVIIYGIRALFGHKCKLPINSNQQYINKYNRMQ
jgi:hypothetical protein